LPVFEPEESPQGPVELFLAWLDDAVRARIPAPHAMVLSTADAAGEVSARTLILKDLDARGWHFATQASSPKGRALAENPRAALTFLWAGLGRQVRLAGEVTPLGPELSAADFLARPEGSRAAALVGHQSEPLAGREEYWSAFDDALRRVREDPAATAPGWSAYALSPRTVEFWQATPDRGQIRLRYRATGDGWTKGLLWP
jgi:pyridoxamine 5'-phosphate oxidase